MAMTMPMKHIIAGIVLALLGLAYGLYASQLPVRSGLNVPGPAFFPYLIAGLVTLRSAALFIQGVRGLRQAGGAAGGVSVPVRAGAIVVWFALFIAVLPHLGFLIAGIPFFAGLMLMCGTRRWVAVGIWSVVIPMVLFHLFRQGFQILLPNAPWM